MSMLQIEKQHFLLPSSSYIVINTMLVSNYSIIKQALAGPEERESVLLLTIPPWAGNKDNNT